MGNSPDAAFAQRHFGAARFHRYLVACDNDVARALALYDWNIGLSGAFWEALNMFEVALRNAIDKRMCEIHALEGRDGHWLFDNTYQLGRDRSGRGRHEHPFLDVAMAMRRVQTNGRPMSGDQIVSELSFGFWHQMVSSRQLFLWPGLVRAFPYAPDRNQRRIHDRVARLRTIRNRIGHHHRIWSHDVESQYEDLLEVAGYIDVKLPGWIEARCRVRTVLERRPYRGQPAEM